MSTYGPCPIVKGAGVFLLKGGIHMLSVAVHKDITEYEPKVVGKLTMRTLWCITAAIGITLIVAGYCSWVLGLSSTIVMYLSFAISIPFWLMGFFRPKGMKFEVFARYWFEYEMHDKKLFYAPSFALLGLVEKKEPKNKKKKGERYDKHYRKFVSEPGIEAYSPKHGRVF